MTQRIPLGAKFGEIADKICLQIPEDYYFDPGAFRIQFEDCCKKLGCPFPQQRQFYRRLDMCCIPLNSLFSREHLREMILLALWLRQYPKRGAGFYQLSRRMKTKGG